ncbi:MAG TPA: hypothetical protein VFB79_07655 [Candidatus Angelobacter sp.]|nr:hypothetical protein [Candidatus Angelobacter sp.]
MDQKQMERIEALQLAIRFIDGTAGGYQASEKQEAISTLEEMIEEMEAQ